ncbi:MAG: hypothetical protein AAF609_23895 [Cyanobacteria bacterium P01_C01_bin.120]
MQQSHSIDFKLVQRVCLLQQALDQALESLDELAAQLKDKHQVETQLASTEKYANVQQQAIAHLKHQLSQFTEIQNHLLGVIGFRINELIDQQQQGFDQLNIQFQQSHTELQRYLQYLTQHQTAARFEPGSEEHRLALEAELMVTRSMAVHLSKYLGLSKQHLDYLNGDLSDHHFNLSQIIKTIQAMIADLATFDRTPTGRCREAQSSPAVKDELLERSPIDSEPMNSAVPDLAALQTENRRQQVRIQELQAMLMAQADDETQLRQRLQAVAAERDYYRCECRKMQNLSSKTSLSANEPPSVQSLSAVPDSADLLSPSPSKQRRSNPSQPIRPLQLPPD